MAKAWTLTYVDEDIVGSDGTPIVNYLVRSEEYNSSSNIVEFPHNVSKAYNMVGLSDLSDTFDNPQELSDSELAVLADLLLPFIGEV